ncbi:MAG: glycosyltransferase [Thermoanaerobaculia bacterium]
MPSPLVIAGMHRSGTSLVASYVAALGVRLGDRLLDADARNPHGYFEDVEFRELQGRILEDCTAGQAGGHRDWGWTPEERLDQGRLAGWTEEARKLVEARARRADATGIWGWKDPRTTLLLDFWDEILQGQARYLLLYRFPWEVADSMQRLGAAVFLDNPEYAAPIWAFYNRHLLDFHQRHPGRSVLVSANALLREPARLAPILAKLGIAAEGAPPDELRDPDLFASLAPEDPLISLWAAASPGCTDLLADLDAGADLPARGLWNPRPLNGGRLLPGGAVDLSVVIPCYDHGEFLIEAVASVERSVPDRCELIVVNDGSRQPRTLEVLEALRQGGYRVVDQPNSGLAAARNRGIAESRGRYVLPLDSDNRLLPGFAAEAIRVLDGQLETGVVYGDRIDFGARSGRVAVPAFDLDALLWANFIDACAVIRREALEAAGGYDAGAAAWEDWDLWISAAERGWAFHRLPEPTFEYRVRPRSMLGLAEGEGLRREVREHIYRKHAEVYQRRGLEVLLTGQAQLLTVQAVAQALQDARGRLQDDADRLHPLADALWRERDELAARVDALWREKDEWAIRAAELAREGESLRRRLALLERSRLAWGRKD